MNIFKSNYIENLNEEISDLDRLETYLLKRISQYKIKLYKLKWFNLFKKYKAKKQLKLYERELFKVKSEIIIKNDMMLVSKIISQLVNCIFEFKLKTNNNEVQNE